MGKEQKQQKFKELLELRKYERQQLEKQKQNGNNNIKRK